MEQMEFSFVEDMDIKEDLTTPDDMLEEDAVDEFTALMDKYCVSEEDIERIQLVAKFI